MFWGATGKMSPLHNRKVCNYVNHIATVGVGCVHNLILGF